MNQSFTPKLTPRHHYQPSPRESTINLSDPVQITRQNGNGIQSRRALSSLSSRQFNSTTYIVSLITNKANQVGISAVNLRSTKIFLTQHTETSYSCQYTINLIREYSPVEIIFPMNLKKSKIVDVLVSEFPHIKMTFIARKYFNDTKGYLKLKSLCVTESSIEKDVLKKYLCVSAFFAVIEYIQSVEQTTFSKHSFDVRYKPADLHLLLDSITIQNLELINNLTTGGIENSLFSMLNHTKTPMGKRLLRTSILQPLTDVTTIQTRHECIDEFLVNEDGYLSLSQSLDNFVDLEFLLSKFTKTFTNFSSKNGDLLLSNLIQLKHCLLSIPIVCESIKSFKSKLICSIRVNLVNKEIEQVLSEINSYINTDIKYTKNVLNMQTQKCFAVLQGKNGLLDVARRVYSDTISEIHELKKTVEDKTGIDLIMNYTTKKGYYFLLDSNLKLTISQKNNFISIYKRGKKILCTTQQLVNYNRRLFSTINEIYLQSEKVLKELIGKLRKHIFVLTKSAESIGLLDLLFSFSTVVILNRGYLRPKLTEKGPVAFIEARNPIIDNMKSFGNYIPNNTYIYESSNFQIITGPNNSGKSTYIKQVGVLVILAHIGCYIPAKFASTRIFDRVFTKLSLNDEIETNCSTFMVEMKEVAHIIQNATNDSLILIDELGRGTSNIEGAAIAWAVCEFLLNLKAYTLFITHYLQLVELESLYPNVKNFHLEVNSAQNKLNYIFRLAEGSTNEDNYGIKLAKILGTPKEIIEEAYRLHEKVSENFIKKNGNIEQNNDDYSKMRRKFRLGGKILSLKYSSLDFKGIKDYLKKLKLEFNDIEKEDKEKEDKMEIDDEKENENELLGINSNDIEIVEEDKMKIDK